MQLSGQNEIVEPYRAFYDPPMLQMPFLVSGKDEKGKVVDVPREPASYAIVIGRRLEAPEDVRSAWQNFLFTGDGSTAGEYGDQLIVLDAEHLRELKPESEVYRGALVLPDGAWDELKAQKGVLYLTQEQVQEAEGKGYIKKNGVWVPANKTVGKVWETLSRGRDLKPYIELAHEKSPNSNSLLNVYFNRTTKDRRPTMRAWVADIININSNANGNYDLSNIYGRLVGVAPEAHAARENFVLGQVAPTLEQVLSLGRKHVSKAEIKKFQTDLKKLYRN